MDWVAAPSYRLVALLLLLLHVTSSMATRPAGWDPQDEKRARIGSSRAKFNNKNKRREKANIVLLMTDDQDIELGSLNYMPKTRRILAEGGATFPNAFVTTPMCCPSRSSMLTGMYVHNHNTYTNNDNCSSVEWQQTYETRNFGTYLSNAGYRTGYFGKYLNEYQGTYIPPGWSEWVGLIRNSRFYNYSLNFNGKKIKHGDNYYKDYLTDLIANDSVTFLKQSKQYFPNRPVAMVLSFPAPHGPEDAAPQYQHLFPNVTTHRTPSWNFAPNPDKQWILQHTGKMEPIHISFTDQLQRKRLQTLQSVDDAVEKIYFELKELGELDNTYILYTSDHGYHLGQYGLLKGKAMPYDFDIRVPFFMRGPTIPRGIRVPNIALNIDLAPTMLDIGGVDIPGHMDGRSLLKIFEGADEPGSIVGGTLRRKKAWRDTFLVERGKLNEKKLRIRERLEGRKNNLVQTKDQRLKTECDKAEYQPPCGGTQQWECRTDPNGKLRIHKCRNKKHNLALPKHELTGIQPQEDEVCHCERAALDPAYMNRGEKKRQRAFLRQVVNQPKMLRPKFLRARRHLRAKSDANGDAVRRTPPDVTARDGDAKDGERSMFGEEGLLQVKRNNRKRRRGRRMDTDSSVPDERDIKPGHRFRYKRSAQGPEVWCEVMRNGTVVCDDTVYENFDSWKEQKNQLDSMIQDYKERLDRLKDIRKHLKDSRPEVDTPVVADPFDLYPPTGLGSDHDPSGEGEEPLLGQSQQGLQNQSSSEVTTEGQDKSLEVNVTLPEGHIETQGTDWTTEFPSDPDDEDDLDGEFDGEDGNEGQLEEEDFFEEEDEDTDDLDVAGLSPGMVDAITEEGFYDPDCSCDVIGDEKSEKRLTKMQRRLARAEKKRERRKKRKKNRKERKKDRETFAAPPGLDPTGPVEVTKDCNSRRMKCFTHDNDHWKTPPLWNSSNRLPGSHYPVGVKPTTGARRDPLCQRPGLECSRMDNEHWRTEPRWTHGPFCFCPNSNNNTYWCLRTINDTHNFIYCEFITGFISFYDFVNDPYQLQNVVHDLSYGVLQRLHDNLEKLKSCRGYRECTFRNRPTTAGKKRTDWWTDTDDVIENDTFDDDL